MMEIIFGIITGTENTLFASKILKSLLDPNKTICGLVAEIEYINVFTLFFHIFLAEK